MELSADQAEANAAVAAALTRAGIDIAEGSALPERPEAANVIAVTGRAGTGKTRLLAGLVAAVEAAGVDVISSDWEVWKTRDRRTLAVLAPTNKAASVLRNRGVPATTIHRIVYTPVYDPDYEAIAKWLAGEAERPVTDALAPEALDRAATFYKAHGSIPGALATAGLRGSDFIKGWTRREAPLDIAFVDEASMLDKKQMEDLEALFSTIVLFGDPAQLAPVGGDGSMVFDDFPEQRRKALTTIHRQAAGNPILRLAHALADPALEFEAFEGMVREAAGEDDRVRIAERVDADLMARAPVLVWRNATRVRLIAAFRAAHGAPEDVLLPGEPLICDGVELPLRHRKKRIDLEARGLVKGAQVIYVGPGRKPGFSRLHVVGAEEPQVNAATIIKIELPGEEEPFIPAAASMGASFLHGAASTIHKAQGSQWPEVQVFAPDLYAAARSGRAEAGLPLWKRLAYVAITRAEERLHWVTRYRLARPARALTTDDLAAPRPALKLEAEADGE